MKNQNRFGYLFFFLSLILIGQANAAIYYIDATNGNDGYKGLSSEKPWKTLSKINSSIFYPGDFIKLKCGEVWREKLIISSSGSSGAPITITKYGEGKNPLILQTENFSNWTLLENNVYRGSIGDNKRYFGMLNFAGNARVNTHIAKPNYNIWQDEYFAGYYGNDNRYFYFRSNSGKPGPREVGVREFGIYINNKDYITLDGIDIHGPSGTISSEIESNDCGALLVNNSKHVTIKYCNIKYAKNFGIRFTGKDTSNSVIENCDIEYSTIGIYFINTGPNHRISWARITKIGTVMGDTGDRPFIAVRDTDYVTIEDCYMDTQGNGSGDHIDAGVTFCCGAGYGIVRRSHIKNSARSAIIIGATDQSPDSYFYFYYNVIDGWGERFSDISRIRSGLYLGGGDRNNYPFSANARVFNNLFINGPTKKSTSNRDAAITVDGYSFGEIILKNNIIFSSNDVYDLYFNPNSYKIREITNNYIYSESKTSISLYGTIYGQDKIECQDKYCFQFNGRDYIKNNSSKNPKLMRNAGKLILSPDSPCIDNGISVGLSNDHYNNPVPAGKTVDIGPFEYQDSDKVHNLLPPKNFRIKSSKDS